MKELINIINMSGILVTPNVICIINTNIKERHDHVSKISQIMNNLNIDSQNSNFILFDPDNSETKHNDFSADYMSVHGRSHSTGVLLSVSSIRELPKLARANINYFIVSSQNVHVQELDYLATRMKLEYSDLIVPKIKKQQIYSIGPFLLGGRQPNFHYIYDLEQSWFNFHYNTPWRLASYKSRVFSKLNITNKIDADSCGIIMRYC